MTTPLSIFRESVKAVPAVKYALGVAGLVSVIAIVRSFNLDARVAVLGAVVMFLLMTVLVVFARLSSLAAPDFRLPALTFTWFSLILVIAIALLMFLSVFFRWPVDLQDWIKPSPAPSHPLTSTSPATDPPGIMAPAQGSEGPSSLIDVCPEITIVDASKYPPEYRKERRCIP
jgi:hypothetical protein